MRRLHAVDALGYIDRKKLLLAVIPMALYDS
jgi:hypothetical protein